MNATLSIVHHAPLHISSYLSLPSATVQTQWLTFTQFLLRNTDQRRNNVEFRRNLLKERKKLEKAASAQASKARASQGEALKNAVREMRNERTPQSVEEREAYFLEQVAMGEALAAQGKYSPISLLDRLEVKDLRLIYPYSSTTHAISSIHMTFDQTRARSP